jgi:hypothetical protein
MGKLQHLQLTIYLRLMTMKQRWTQTTVALLCTGVKSCDEDEYKKFKWMLQFLRATKDDYLTLSANSLHNVRWWVDASYAVHTLI